MAFTRGSAPSATAGGGRAAIPIEPTTPSQIAALIGCAVTTGIGAVVNTTGMKAGESVVVMGLAGVGTSAVMGATLAQARTIVALDPIEQQLELARQAGVTHATSDADEVDNLTDGRATM